MEEKSNITLKINWMSKRTLNSSKMLDKQYLE